MKPARLINKVRLALLYSFPLVLYFSYYPIIPLFSTASTNYELSLPLIWLLLFSVLSLKDFAHYIYNIYIIAKPALKPLKSNSSLTSLKLALKSLLSFAPLSFLLYLSLSVLWSLNPLRGFLTVGIYWCLYISSVVILTTFRSSLNKPLFLKIFLLSAVLISCFCWLQAFLDALGVPEETTLLCRGCTSRIFGFPHPSGFAIEPQFMGNLLLAPVLTSLYLLFSCSKTSKKLFPKPLLIFISFFLLATLFLVFSRGAIYSFAVAFLLLLVLNLFKLKNKSFLFSLPLIFSALLFILFSQGFLAVVNQTYEKSFSCAVSTSLSQLSLDSVNLPCKEAASSESTDPSASSAPPELSPANTDSSPETSPVYSGYIAESTDVRLSLSRSALEASSETNLSWFFGYGLGSAGTVLNEKGKTSSPKEIVQNEYLSLLLETGVVGLLLFFVVILTTISLIRSHFTKLPALRYLFYSVILSLLLSLLFFSGLPNALHIYLFPVFLLAEYEPIINQKVNRHYDCHHQNKVSRA